MYRLGSVSCPLTDRERPRLSALGGMRRAASRAEGSLGRSFRIVAPTAILGYGFPTSSFLRALREPSAPVDLVAVDAGSIDPGPYYLATRSSFTALEHVIRDLRTMIRGFLEVRSGTQGGGLDDCSGKPTIPPLVRTKLVIGSAGGCGTDNQVDIMAREVRRLIVEEVETPSLHTQRSQL